MNIPITSILSLLFILVFIMFSLTSMVFIIIFFIPNRISIYRIPLFLYLMSLAPILLLTSVIDYLYQVHNNLIVYFLGMLLYLFIMLFSLYIKTKNEESFKNRSDDSTFIRIINQHEVYFKTFFLPFSFLILIIGFIASVLGYLKDIPQPQIYFGSLLNWFFSTPGIWGFDNMFPLLGKVMLVITLLSLPAQVLAYFIIKVIQYFYKFSSYYINFLKGIFKFISKLW